MFRARPRPAARCAHRPGDRSSDRSQDAVGQEGLARHCPHGIENGWIADPAALKLSLDHHRTELDKTLQTTNTWLSELMETTGPDRRLAWHVLGAVMRSLRDRLPLELAVHLGAQLPLLVRGLYFDQWHAPAQVDKVRDVGGFLDRIRGGLSDVRPVNVELATSAVFNLLDRHIPAGRLGKVRQALPSEIRALWPDGARGEAHSRRADKADGHDRTHARSGAPPGENI